MNFDPKVQNRISSDSLLGSLIPLVHIGAPYPPLGRRSFSQIRPAVLPVQPAQHYLLSIFYHFGHISATTYPNLSILGSLQSPHSPHSEHPIAVHHFHHFHHVKFAKSRGQPSGWHGSACSCPSCFSSSFDLILVCCPCCISSDLCFAEVAVSLLWHVWPLHGYL